MAEQELPWYQQEHHAEAQVRKEEMLSTIKMTLEIRFGNEGLQLMPQVIEITDLGCLQEAFRSIASAATIKEVREVIEIEKLINSSPSIDLMNRVSPPLIEALDAVKISKRCDMFDSKCVISTMKDLGYTLQSNWLKARSDDFFNIITSEYIRWMWENSTPSESLARKVARDTGLEVIVE